MDNLPVSMILHFLLWLLLGDVCMEDAALLEALQYCCLQWEEGELYCGDTCSISVGLSKVFVT